jgi:hypothetical protein
MYDILGLLKYWKENFYMRSLEKYLSEANLGNWTHLLWQNGYTTPEEFIEIGIDDLKLIEIPEREINALLEVVDNIKKDMVDAQEFSSEESVYYLETLYTDNQNIMYDLKQEKNIDDKNIESLWKSYNLQAIGSSGIVLPNYCPVCLKPTYEKVKRKIGWTKTVYSKNGITKTRKTKSETVTLYIPCCHKNEMKKYFECWMENKGEVKFLIKNKEYAESLVTLNGQRFPHEISIQEYKSIKFELFAGNVIGIVKMLIVPFFIISMLILLVFESL